MKKEPPLNRPFVGQAARSRSLGETAATLHWAHWLTLLMSAGITLAGYFITRGQVEEKVQARFNHHAEHVVELVVERMVKYEDALWSGVAALQGLGGDATYEQWETFASAMQIEKKYPGINGIGIIHQVPSEKLATYLDQQRASRPDFQVHPAHVRGEYWPISYIEPLEPNRQAVGLDVAHEDNRYRAAVRARDLGLAQITGPIVLVQDAHRTPGFLFYAPFYRVKSPEPDEPSEFGGLVYAPFVVERLMQGTLERANRHVGVRIIDDGETIFDEHQPSDPRFDPNPLYSAQLDVPLYGRIWRFDLRSDHTFRAAAGMGQPLTILVGGTTIDVLLLLLFLGMAKSNTKAVAYADAVTAELRSQRDELEFSNGQLTLQTLKLEQARGEAELARTEAERATQTKAAFLATMSHELRTPMNGVIATAELLVDARGDDERLQLVDTIITSGQTLLALINDILDFSKLEAGRVELDPQPTDLRVLIAEVVRLMEPLVETKGVLVTTKIDRVIPPLVLVDALRLRQVLLNLCSNAVKFTERGRVHVTCSPVAGRDSVYDFSIEDSGIGIEHPEHLFEEFTQADASTTRKFGGTGLGLAICRQLVDLMGGSIAVESRLGSGSRFWFRLGLSPVCEEVSRPPESDRSGLQELVAGRALVVDDNPVNRMVAEKLLHRLGWRSESAENGEQAVLAATTHDYDLILMDCQMPVLDGFEATRRILLARTDVAPIIALTANALADDRQRCLDAGMSDYLTKPIRSEPLRQMLLKWGTIAAHGRGAEADAKNEPGGIKSVGDSVVTSQS